MVAYRAWREKKTDKGSFSDDFDGRKKCDQMKQEKVFPD